MYKKLFYIYFLVSVCLLGCATVVDEGESVVETAVPAPTSTAIPVVPTNTSAIPEPTATTAVPYPVATQPVATAYPAPPAVEAQVEAAYPAAENSTQIYSYRILNAYPHDPNAFTQGLIYTTDGVLYEGTGLRGRSSLRRVDLLTGEVQQLHALDDAHFGEGITLFENKIYQLTWQSRLGFIYDKDSFELIQQFEYPTEGWGITHDGSQLIMSDGSAIIRFWDPDTLAETRQIEIRDVDGTAVTLINELEYIEGEIFANIWQSDVVARIDPATGQVIGWLDLSGLLTPEEQQQADVLNGIAYDSANKRLFVTGKLWPKLFEIALIPAGG